MEEREEGMSLGEVFSLMFKKKLILLIITLAVAAVMMVGLLALYNPSKRKLDIEFTYEKTTLANGYYADGKVFRMNDIISLENIENVIASDDKYSVLDAQDIYEAASLEEIIEKDEAENYKTYQKVSVLAKRLKNSKLGKDFLIDLVNYPVKDNINIMSNINMKQQLDQYDQSKTYADAFGHLRSAYNYLVSQYQSTISTFGDIKYKDKSNFEEDLSARLLSIQVNVANRNLDTYLNADANGGLIIDYGLILDYGFSRQSIQNNLNETNDNLDLVDNQLAAIKEQYDAIIDAISQSQATILSADAQSILERWASLTSSRTQIVKSKEKIELRLENESSQYIYVGTGGIKSQQQYNDLDSDQKSEYSRVVLSDVKTEIKNLLDNLYTYLDEQIDLLREIKIGLANNENFIYYQSNEQVKSSGGLNSILAIILSLLAGLVIGCIVSFILSYPDFKVKKQKELNEKEDERIRKQIAYQKMLKETDSKDEK